MPVGLNWTGTPVQFSSVQLTESSLLVVQGQPANTDLNNPINNAQAINNRMENRELWIYKLQLYCSYPYWIQINMDIYLKI